MISLTLQILIALYCLVLYFYCGYAYNRIKGDKWFSFNWSGHASLLCALVFILGIFGLSFSVLNIVAGMLAIADGLGLCILMILFGIENKRIIPQLKIPTMTRFSPLLWFEVFLSHIFLAVIGIAALNMAVFSESATLFALAFLFVYYLLMFDKYHVRWILYSPSHVNQKLRLLLLRISTILLYLLVPLILSSSR